jgi:class 3 adenylate cyclase
MQQIAEWLEKLGMSEYAQLFIENRIDFEILPDLTDQDLEKLGVVLGDRRKMLRAIAKLEDATAQPSDAPSAAVTSLAAQTSVSEVVGERRYITVMFCDLVDPTGIAARLDAEEWRELVGAYLDAASAAVTEMGGTVAKKLGDGLMALFGYPIRSGAHGPLCGQQRALRPGAGDLRSCRTRSTYDAFWPGCRGGPLGVSFELPVVTRLS